MTDRELLKLAAKAAGLEEFQYINGEPAYRFQRTGLQDWKRWNPLTDDGDALRLAVQLRLDIRAEARQSVATPPPRDPDRACWGWSQAVDGDPYAAMRRAIVQVAAALVSEDA